jgi:hypothetical protein
VGSCAPGSPGNPHNIIRASASQPRASASKNASEPNSINNSIDELRILGLFGSGAAQRKVALGGIMPLEFEGALRFRKNAAQLRYRFDGEADRKRERK